MMYRSAILRNSANHDLVSQHVHQLKDLVKALVLLAETLRNLLVYLHRGTAQALAPAQFLLVFLVLLLLVDHDGSVQRAARADCQLPLSTLEGTYARFYRFTR